MAILSKGATIVADTQVSATNLNNLVDAATFVSGAVDGTTTQLSGGAIIVKDGGITPAKLSTGGPSWTTLGVRVRHIILWPHYGQHYSQHC
jgi:hypothetical protein